MQRLGRYHISFLNSQIGVMHSALALQKNSSSQADHFINSELAPSGANIPECKIYDNFS
jgi:hypothetical protein